jgi:DNA-binding NtrC family response regulator
MVYPQKHLMIVEDIISNQRRVLDHFAQIFDSDGLVQISLVPGAIAAASIIKSCKIDVIILDHDLPEGNGSDLLTWMKAENIKIPVITFSGIPYNNTHMGNLGAEHIYGKEDVISGNTDVLIKSLLGV